MEKIYLLIIYYGLFFANIRKIDSKKNVTRYQIMVSERMIVDSLRLKVETENTNEEWINFRMQLFFPD